MMLLRPLWGTHLPSARKISEHLYLGSLTCSEVQFGRMGFVKPRAMAKLEGGALRVLDTYCHGCIGVVVKATHLVYGALLAMLAHNHAQASEAT